MKQLLTLLVNLLATLLQSYTKTLSNAPVTSLPESQILLKETTSNAIKEESLKIAASFATKFGTWSDNDKELIKRIATLNAIKVHDLNADELLEYSALLDKASELSRDQSALLNEFKNQVFDSVETVVTKAGEIGSKIAVGLLIAAI